MKLLARNVTVERGNLTLPGLTDCSLNLTTVFATSQTKADITPIDEPLRVDWEISVTGEFGREESTSIYQDVIKTQLKTGVVSLTTFKIGDLATYQGKALVTAYSENAPEGGKITYTATFRGVNLLTKKVATTSE